MLSTAAIYAIEFKTLTFTIWNRVEKKYLVFEEIIQEKNTKLKNTYYYNLIVRMYRR